MRQFVVSEAPASRMAQHVRETVEEAGGIVAHHTAAKTEFDHLDVSDETWRRAGYVGTYQRFKEKPVHVRIRVWAQWPRRLLLGSIYVGFAIALLFFLASIVEVAIAPNVWILTALPILALIAAGVLMHTSSIADSRTAEAGIERRLVDRLTGDEQIPGEIYDVDEWEAYRERVVDEAREEARQQVPHGGSALRGALADVGEAVSSVGSGDEPAETEPDARDEPAADGIEDADGEDEAEATPARTGPEGEAEGSESDGRFAKLKRAIGIGEEEPTEESDAEDADEASPASA